MTTALEKAPAGPGSKQIAESVVLNHAGMQRSASGGANLFDDANTTTIVIGGGAANTTTNLNAGSSSDLTFGARGATITLNESGQTSLDGNFAATSVVAAINELNNKAVQFVVFAPTTDVTVGEGAIFFTIPDTLNGLNLLRAQATLVTAGVTGATTVMVRNFTDSVDMLSGVISIASAATVGTPGTVDTDNDDVATDDILRIDVDSASTGTIPKGLMVILTFGL